MKVVIQRVKSASVSVNDSQISCIGKGFLCLVGIHETDGPADADWMIKQIISCKLFPGEDGKPWKRNISQIEGELLMVSQFTLYGKVYKRGKMDFHHAMSPDAAREYYSRFLDSLKEKTITGKVYDGAFGEIMEVSLLNDGPITITLDSFEAIPREENNGPEEEKQLQETST
uniref:D-aminoacyl-tRNA deacylase n=1 Tax=Fibrocapsa japonica TaxID=94617 RepID=A0A7S2V4R2_9STRA|mmetsp:Transcript_4280/g.6403  ORF Transcript_4280/g.6403 Transcript_4280/m.6403 type:complete len:172 (+) Transcript_4280:72-587(+)|eukprot:CAMPEP_0113939906 /NCGR_PEP_ID=MMETSP1339-20121228/6133_1 /TAXON_ID=94617 /ORGANISM="Fibrocapsa japonica" /LENGTH=171 /DNA_ID=CAMNT_0000943545 /DNA_START=72 /DNA_END=587 /DNA_ORIENTATION=- /assembly_acc=CAM_ASM_000762